MPDEETFGDLVHARASVKYGLGSMTKYPLRYASTSAVPCEHRRFRGGVVISHTPEWFRKGYLRHGIEYGLSMLESRGKPDDLVISCPSKISPKGQLWRQFSFVLVRAQSYIFSII